MISAFNDNRYTPISLDENSNVRAGVTILSKFEKGKDPYDWEIGTHGIIIEFNENEKDYRGTYLPNVIV